MLSGDQLTRNAARREEARAQYSHYNRRVAAVTANLASVGFGGGEEMARFLCTCGRAECTEDIFLSLREYARVLESPHRFLVAPHHDTEADVVVENGSSEYWVVEVKPEYRIDD